MEAYRRIARNMEPHFSHERFPTEDAYVEKMQAILSAYPNIGVPREPTAISGGVYVGSTANAENISLLKSMGIKYVLNCGGTRNDFRYRRIRQFYTPESGVQGYEELAIFDSETGDVRSYFDRAHAFINYARSRNCKVLIHCPGVSRSGAIAISYLIRNGIPLLEATSILKQSRRCALSNEGFMRQLVVYARERACLESNPGGHQVPDYYRRLNHHRIVTAHLPLNL